MYYYDDKVTMFDEYFSKLKCITWHPHSSSLRYPGRREDDTWRKMEEHTKHLELDVFDAQS